MALSSITYRNRVSMDGICAVEGNTCSVERDAIQLSIPWLTNTNVAWDAKGVGICYC